MLMCYKIQVGYSTNDVDDINSNGSFSLTQALLLL